MSRAGDITWPRFQECEWSSCRAYVDDLYAADWQRVRAALVRVKNAVIGSNRQKASLIQQGVVPRLLQLLQQDDAPDLRLDAALTIGRHFDFRSHFSRKLFDGLWKVSEFSRNRGVS